MLSHFPGSSNNFSDYIARPLNSTLSTIWMKMHLETTVLIKFGEEWTIFLGGLCLQTDSQTPDAQTS